MVLLLLGVVEMVIVEEDDDNDTFSIYFYIYIYLYIRHEPTFGCWGMFGWLHSYDDDDDATVARKTNTGTLSGRE